MILLPLFVAIAAGTGTVCAQADRCLIGALTDSGWPRETPAVLTSRCTSCGHTTASRLVQKGVPIYTVSKWLGHSSVRITERYAKLAPDSLGKALAALEAEAKVSV